MMKSDCGRAPVPEKRAKREPDEADRTEAKVEGLGVGLLEFSADLDAQCPSKMGGGGGVAPHDVCALDTCFSLRRAAGRSAPFHHVCPLCRSLVALGIDPATVQSPN